MSDVVGFQLQNDQVKRLEAAARQLGCTPAEAAVLLLERALRQREFAHIEIRDTMIGPQAYIKGSRLPVWMVIRLLRDLDGEMQAAAEYLGVPVLQILAASSYAETFPEEIDGMIADSYPTYEELKRRYPSLELVEADATAS